jgi:hypothetical protein
MANKNRNIRVLNEKDLENEINYNNFQYKNYFHHICDLFPNNDKEKIDIIEIKNVEEFKKAGLVYIFVIDEKILKIGHTITPMNKRIQSYNCGKTEYRIAGTCSTTNWFILQSILKIDKIVNVYGYYTPNPAYNVLGKNYENSIPASKQAEKEILNTIEKKPIGNTQT